jgi:hypothetical protein
VAAGCTFRYRQILSDRLDPSLPSQSDASVSDATSAATSTCRFEADSTPPGGPYYSTKWPPLLLALCPLLRLHQTSKFRPILLRLTTSEASKTTPPLTRYQPTHPYTEESIGSALKDTISHQMTQESSQECGNKAGAFGNQRKIDISGSVSDAIWQSVAGLARSRRPFIWQIATPVALFTT